MCLENNNASFTLQQVYKGKSFRMFNLLIKKKLD